MSSNRDTTRIKDLPVTAGSTVPSDMVIPADGPSSGTKSITPAQIRHGLEEAGAAAGAVADHVGATDPHGDRAYADGAVADHVGDTDPHGDRAYADDAVADHVGDTDPHGDRAYADDAVADHVGDTDPHGDRAYADDAVANLIRFDAPQSLSNEQKEQAQENMGVEIGESVQAYSDYLSSIADATGEGVFIKDANGDHVRVYVDPSLSLSVIDRVLKVTPPAVRAKAPFLTWEEHASPATPPSPLSEDFIPWGEALYESRLASIPLARATQWYFSHNGNDTTGTGERDAPLRSLTRANALMFPPRGMGTGGAAISGPSGTNYQSSTGYAICGWVSTGFNGSGSLLVIPGAFGVGVGLFRAGIGHDKTPFCYTLDGGSQLLFDSAAFPDGSAVQFLLASVSPSGTARIRVGSHVVTGTLTAPAAATSGALSAVSFNGPGGYARLGIFNRPLTEEEEETIFEGGLGWRRFEMQRYLPDAWAACKSWWDCDDGGSSADSPGARTLADAKGIGPLNVSAGGQGNTLGADPAITGNYLGGCKGGADIEVLFERGGRYEGLLAVQRAGVTVRAYGDPFAAKPLITNFTTQFTGNVWTNDGSGTGTYWTSCPTEVVRVKKIGENAKATFSTPLILAEDIADCRTTAGSMVWDSGSGGRLYLRVGGDPNTVAPNGWEGVPAVSAGMAGSMAVTREQVRLDSLSLLGGGMSNPGHGSGYGIQFSLPAGIAAGAEQAITNCDVFYTGYHAIGFIQQVGGIGVSGGNVAGLCTLRNESFGVGDITTWVWYVGGSYVTPAGTGQECYSKDDEAWGGHLPDYAEVGGATSDAFFSHDAPALMLFIRPRITNAGFSACVRGITAFSGGTTLTAARAWVIQAETDYGLDVTVPYKGSVLIGCIGRVAAGVGGTYLRSVGVGDGSDGPAWLINCVQVYDLTDNAGPFTFWGNMPPDDGRSENWINGHIAFVNAGAKTVELYSAAVPSGNPGNTLLNTVLSSDGSVDVAFGAGITPTDLDTCAFFGFDSDDVGDSTDPVTLSDLPEFAERPVGGSELLGAGNASGAPEYDAYLDQHVGGVPIGPVG